MYISQSPFATLTGNEATTHSEVEDRIVAAIDMNRTFAGNPEVIARVIETNDDDDRPTVIPSMPKRSRRRIVSGRGVYMGYALVRPGIEELLNS